MVVLLGWPGPILRLRSGRSHNRKPADISCIPAWSACTTPVRDGEGAGEPDQPGVILVESLFDSLLNEAVGRGVAFLLLPEPQAQQHTQPIRLQSQDRIGLAEEEYL